MNRDNANNVFNRPIGIAALLALADPLDDEMTMRIIERSRAGFRNQDTIRLFSCCSDFLCLIATQIESYVLHSRKYIIICQGTEFFELISIIASRQRSYGPSNATMLFQQK